MEREDFVYLFFKIEEFRIAIDHWRSQTSDCKQCRGWAEEAYGNLCSSCHQALSEEFKALETVADISDIRGTLWNLEHGLSEDKTGELTLIFKLATGATPPNKSWLEKKVTLIESWLKNLPPKNS
jgi:hypothetical protein